MQDAAGVVGWGTSIRDYSHSPLDILHQGARVRRIIELDCGHVSTTAISRLQQFDASRKLSPCGDNLS